VVSSWPAGHERSQRMTIYNMYELHGYVRTVMDVGRLSGAPGGLVLHDLSLSLI
jgi:hypothetical protein